MIALVAVELRRLFARRLVKALMVLMVLGMVFGAVVAYFQSDGLSSTFVYEEVGDEGLLGSAPLLCIIGLVIGASFVGAEWQAGSMTTLLTWEPRRLRVLAAKTIAAVLGVAAILILMQALLLVIFLPVGMTRGTTAGVDAQWFKDTAGIAGRISIAGGLSALLGLAIATIGRNTAAALGAAFGYFAIIESLLRGLKPQWRPWFVGDNIAAMIVADPGDPAQIGHTGLEAGLVVAGYTLLLLAIAALFFKQRDVT